MNLYKKLRITILILLSITVINEFMLITIEQVVPFPTICRLFIPNNEWLSKV